MRPRLGSPIHIDGGEKLPVLLSIKQIGHSELLLSVGTLDLLRLFPRHVQRRQQHRSENRDYRNHDEQLDKGEIALFHDRLPFH